MRNALDAAARIRRDQGNLDGAVALYERLMDTFDEADPRRGLYRMRIQEIESARAT